MPTKYIKHVITLVNIKKTVTTLHFYTLAFPLNPTWAKGIGTRHSDIWLMFYILTFLEAFIGHTVWETKIS